MLRVVRSWDRYKLTSATDLPVAFIASALAFALDAEGGVERFAVAAGLFLVLISAIPIISLKSFREGKGVEPLPTDAVIMPEAELRRKAVIRMPLWAVFVAATTALLGTTGAGMALGAAAGGLISGWIWQRQMASRGLETFSPEIRWLGLKPPARNQTWVYTRRLRAEA